MAGGEIGQQRFTEQETDDLKQAFANSPGPWVVPESMIVENIGYGLAPEGGFQPEDFPQISIDLVPYTSNPQLRADPHISITTDGWMYMETGNVRVALPDRQEWTKLVAMGERLWNSHEAAQAAALQPAECNHSEAGVLCRRTDGHSHEVNGKTIWVINGQRQSLDDEDIK